MSDIAEVLGYHELHCPTPHQEQCAMEQAVPGYGTPEYRLPDEERALRANYFIQRTRSTKQ